MSFLPNFRIIRKYSGIGRYIESCALGGRKRCAVEGRRSKVTRYASKQCDYQAK